jgi:type IV pilus assembly protein PilA
MGRIKSFVNDKAFSMSELMVVIAIVTTLAAIGIPRYSKFQAKTKQSEAKLSLSALFTAEESFKQEWNQFSVTLSNIGYSVQGSRLRYKTGFISGANCGSYTTTGGAPSESTTVDHTWSDGSFVNTSSASWSVSITAPSIGTSCSNTAFTAVAYGTPATSPTDPGSLLGDTWTINQTKFLTNSQIFLGD